MAERVLVVEDDEHVSELLAYRLETDGYVVVVPIAFLLGVLNVPFFLLFLVIAVGVGTLLSWLSVLNEVVSFRRYRDPKDVAVLLAYGLVEHVPYRQWKSWVAWVALVRHLRGEGGWGEMVRVGFDR